MKKRHIIRKIILCILAAAIVFIPSYIAITSYVKSLPKLQYTFGTSALENVVSYPDAKFAVISDLHYYDNSLGTTGTAFEEDLNSDRKLLKDSADLLKFAIDNIINSGVQFVLVPGDLTKDGELLDHGQAASALSKLTRKGIKVYVVPGNHDINNPRSFKFEGDKSILVPSITAAQFADIYKDFGYGSAIERDNSSLSYVAEPVQGLWLVALDACRYSENVPGGSETTGGKMSQQQEKWLEGVLQKAEQQGKAVMVMEHHGVLEHWTGQSKLHPQYLVEDYQHISRLMASYGVRLAFTGHYHAQDITLADFGNDGFIYDVETGSLITAPCPVRYCSFEGGKIKITSDMLVGKIHPGTDFQKNAEQFVHDTIEREAYNTVLKYKVNANDARYIADYSAAAFNAHYNGDENIKDRPAFDEKKLGLWSRIVYSQEKYVIDGLWKDLPPQDNNVTLDLSKR